VELRVHGIGGTRPQAVLGLDPTDALVPRWPVGDSSSSGVWVGEDPEVGVYHWAPLTSGSRWFALWPLLLPFTLLIVAGFMHPTGWRARWCRPVHHALCLCASAWMAGWLCLAGQILTVGRWGVWGPRIGLLGAAVAVGALTAVSLVGPKHRNARGTEAVATGRRPGLSDPSFFAERAHRPLLVLHVLVALSVIVWVGTYLDGALSVQRPAGDLIAVVGTVLVALLGLELVLGLRRWPWSLAMMGAAGVGLALIGGTAMAALRTSAGVCSGKPDVDRAVARCAGLRGPAFMLFDIYGWAVLLGIAATVAVVVLALWVPARAERIHGSRRLLPSFDAQLMARAARIPRLLAFVLGLVTLSFVVGGSVAFAYRSDATIKTFCHDKLHLEVPRLCDPNPADGLEAAAEQRYVVVDGPEERVAQLTLAGLGSFVLLGLVQSKLTLAWLRRIWSRSGTAQLRGIGSFWDVLAFWPRSFHPFAIRPYTKRAVPELRELLAGPDAPLGDGIEVLAHSQGTVLVAAALAPGSATERDHSSVARLVTVGSPLRSLYHGAFPAYVTEQLWVDVARTIPGPTPSWTNVFRFTDPVGRTVFSDEPAWCSGVVDIGVAGPVRLPESGGRPEGCADVALPDPRGRQQSVLGHNLYWDDPLVTEILHPAAKELAP
jgi:hypothetical protein